MYKMKACASAILVMSLSVSHAHRRIETFNHRRQSDTEQFKYCFFYDKDYPAVTIKLSRIQSTHFCGALLLEEAQQTYIGRPPVTSHIIFFVNGHDGNPPNCLSLKLARQTLIFFVGLIGFKLQIR